MKVFVPLIWGGGGHKTTFWTNTYVLRIIKVQGLCSETWIKNLGQCVSTGQGNKGQWKWTAQYQFPACVGGVLCLSSNSSCQLPRTSTEPQTKCKRRKESCHQEVSGATFQEGNLGLASSSCERLEWSHRKGNRKTQKRVLLLGCDRNCWLIYFQS